MAALGPSGGGQRPRVRRSGGDILQPEAEGFEDVVLFDRDRSVQVRRGARHPPRAVKTAGSQSPLGAPTLERAARRGRQLRELPQPGGSQLRVETALPVQLSL